MKRRTTVLGAISEPPADKTNMAQAGGQGKGGRLRIMEQDALTGQK